MRLFLLRKIGQSKRGRPSFSLAGFVIFFVGTLLFLRGTSEGSSWNQDLLPEVAVHNADHQTSEYHAMTSMLKKAAGTSGLLHNPSISRWDYYAKMYADKAFSFNGGEYSKDGDALTFLGYNFYFLGIDYIKEALSFFQKGAELGNIDAQCELGTVYLYGRGEIKKDPKLAFLWLVRAGEGGSGVAMNTLGDIFENGKLGEADLDLACLWYKKAADAGNAMGQNNFGRFLNHGYGVEQDASRAVGYYQKAADQGLDWAMHNLGLCYGAGDGVEKDIGKAFEYLTMAGEAGFGKSLLALGDAWRIGDGVPRDPAKAFSYYKEAERAGNIQAKSALGYMYYTGLGVPQSNIEALAHWMQAAHAGDIYAQTNLADMYLLGEGVVVNPAKALKWLRRASKQGSREAAQRIVELGVNENISP